MSEQTAENAVPAPRPAPINPGPGDSDILARIGEAIADPAEVVEVPPGENRAPEVAPPPADPAPETETKADDGEDKADEGTKPETETEPEVITVSSYDDLAEHLGVEVKDLYTVPVPVTMADGTVSEISIGDLKDAFQGNDKIARGRNEVQAQREALETERTQARAAIEQSVMEAAALTQAAEKRLMAEMEGINWTELRDADQGEWAAKRQELFERQNQIRAAKEQIIASHQQQLAQQQVEMRQAYDTHMQQEREALLLAIPEWKDEESAKTERSGLRSYLAETGFADSEIDAAVDHRLIVMARKAQKFDEQAKAASAATKKVLKIGKKVLTPGAKPSREEANHDRLSALRKKHSKDGSVDSAAALIEQLL